MKKSNPAKHKPGAKSFADPKFDPHNLTKVEAHALFDRLWAIAEVSWICTELTRITGRTHQWSFSQSRPADADEPLYQIYAEAGPRGSGGLRLVEHMVSGPFMAVVAYSAGIAVAAAAKAKASGKGNKFAPKKVKVTGFKPTRTRKEAVLK